MRAKEKMYDLKELFSYVSSNYLGDTKLHLRGFSDAGSSEDVDNRLVYYILSVCAYWRLSVMNQYDMTLGSFGA